MFTTLFLVCGMPIYLGAPLAAEMTTIKAMFIISVPMCIFIGAAMAANDIANSVGGTYGSGLLTMP